MQARSTPTTVPSGICRQFLASAALLATLGACAPLSGLGPDGEGAYPQLLPLDQLLAQAPPQRAAVDFATSDAERLAALIARAARLRGGAVVDAATRARMREVQDRHGM